MDYDDNFSSTPDDIEQTITQDYKLPEGVDGRYFINPPSGNPDTGNRDIVYEVLSPLWESFIPKSSVQNKGCIFQE